MTFLDFTMVGVGETPLTSLWRRASGHKYTWLPDSLCPLQLGCATVTTKTHTESPRLGTGALALNLAPLDACFLAPDCSWKTEEKTNYWEQETLTRKRKLKLDVL